MKRVGQGAAPNAATTQAERWKEEYLKWRQNPHVHDPFFRCCFGLLAQHATMNFRIGRNYNCDQHGVWVFPDDSAVYLEFDERGEPPIDPPILQLAMYKRR